MKREEAREILTHNWTRVDNPNYSESELDEAFFMAIEALSLANLKEKFESAVPNCRKCAIKELWEETEKEDLVSVVRCKDCRHLDVWNLKTIYAVCSKHGITFEPFEDDTRTHFCSWGERREEVNGFKSVGQAWNTSQGRWEP